jgi:hypothetical protein
MNANYITRAVEWTLLVINGVAIVALIAVWIDLESILSPGESPALVKARLMRGIFSLAVPLVVLLFVTATRNRVAALLSAQNATSATLQSARYLWFLVMVFVIGILSLDLYVIANGFQDIDFS